MQKSTAWNHVQEPSGGTQLARDVHTIKNIVVFYFVIALIGIVVLFLKTIAS